MAGRIAGFIEELKRRRVIATAGVYLVGAYATMQGVDAVFPYLPVADPDLAGSWVLGLLAAGFPIALLLSWTFDIMPPRLKRDHVDAVESRGSSRRAPKPLRSDAVAVLPFVNEEKDSDTAYFSEGITEDIIASVAHIRGLSVLSRSSVSRYRDSDLRVAEIAAELGVANVVTGSVRRGSNRVRVIAELVDGATDGLLWSATYDREMEDIFEVQGDVAASIAKAVRRELTAADRQTIANRGTTDAEAYDLYLRARYLWNQRTEAAVDESVRYFEWALERDPDFALAHSSLAEAFTILGVYGARAPTDTFPRATEAADHALERDPRSGPAVAARACIAAVFDWDWSTAETEFARALALAPSYPTAHQWLAMNVLAPLGRFDESLKELERASALDPGSSAIRVSQGIVAFYSRAYVTAVPIFEELCSVQPRFALAHLFLGQSQVLGGEVELGLEALSKAEDLSGASSESLAANGHALALAGRTGDAEAVLRRLKERSERRYVSPALLAQLQVGLGRQEESLLSLGNAVDAKAADLIWLAVKPQYDPLRETDGFAEALRQVHLTDVQARLWKRTAEG